MKSQHLLKFLSFAMLIVNSSCQTASGGPAPSPLYLDNDGTYQGLTVFINHSPTLLQDSDKYLTNVQNHIKVLSKALFDSFGVKFGNVTILVPPSWSSDIFMLTRADRSVVPNNIKLLDILIAESRRQDFDIYTQHLLGCGHQALYLYMSPSYASNWTNVKSKQLLHEWLHTRFGVFDEYPIPGSAVDSQKFYFSSDGLIEAVRCSKDINFTSTCSLSDLENSEMINEKTNLPVKSCKFELSEPKASNPSLMSTIDLRNINNVCTKETHNYEAPNQHNRLCNGRSILEVIRQHRDFQYFYVSESYDDPQFSFVKVRGSSRTVAIVIDTSNSMIGQRLHLSLKSIQIILTDVLEDGTYVTIVKFARNAEIHYIDNSNSSVFQLDSPETRHKAAESLNSITTDGYTCIGCGLRLAYDTLKAEGRDFNAYYIVLTDGRETEDIRQVEDMFQKSKLEYFTIDVLVISNEESQKADLIKLASGTSTSIQIISDDQPLFLDAFTELITLRQNYSNQVVQIYSSYKFLSKKAPEFTGYFQVDQLFSSTSRVYVIWRSEDTENHTYITISIGQGNDLHVTEKVKVDQGVWSYDLPASSQPQPFTFRISADSYAVSIPTTVTVYGSIQQDRKELRKKRAANEINDYQQYNIEVYVNGIPSTAVTQDTADFRLSIHAFVPPGAVPTKPESVLATVTYRSMESSLYRDFRIQLQDNGTTSADAIGDDNVFSAYFAQLMPENGTYQVKVQVEGDGFMRYGSTNAFSLYISPSITNVSSIFPPARVVDLTLAEINYNLVTLEFTTSGADFDMGQAAYYWVWYSKSASVLQEGKTQGTVQLKSHNTRPAGETVVITQAIPREFIDDLTVWIAVSVVDEHGLQSDLSNVVSVKPDRQSNMILIIVVVLMSLVLISFVVMIAFGLRYRHLAKVAVPTSGTLPLTMPKMDKV